MNTADKCGPFIGAVMLAACILLYFTTGLNKTFGDFPTKQVLCAVPIAFVVWALCAFMERKGMLKKEVDGVQQGTYYSIPGFITGMLFGSCVFTGMFIIFSLPH